MKENAIRTAKLFKKLQTDLSVYKLCLVLLKRNIKPMSARQRILDSTFSLFHQQGYHSTGINQIIAASKVAKASFYQHFKSKEDLCVAFLNDRHTYWFGKLHAFTSAAQTRKEKITLSFEFLIAMNEAESYRGCSFLNILSEIPKDNIKIMAVIRDHKNDLRAYFQDMLHEKSLADHVYLLFESAIIESQLFSNQWPVNEAISIVNNLLD